MGVSFISSDQACANAESEIPDFDFTGVRQAAFNEWDELLGRIKVNTTGVDANTTQLFYSSLYRTHISPADCKLILSKRFQAFVLTTGQIRERTLCGTQQSHTTIRSTAT